MRSRRWWDKVIPFLICLWVLQVNIEHIVTAQVEVPPTRITAVAWSPDSQKIAAGQMDGKVKIWSQASNQPLLILSGHTDSILSLSWRPDGQQIVSGSFDSTARVWDTNSGEWVQTLIGAESPVTWAGWNPDGSQILTFNSDATNSLRVWSAIDFNLITQKEGDSVYGAVWSPDQSKVAVASLSGNTGILNSDSYTYQTWFMEPQEGQYPHLILTVAWHPDGTRVASGSDAGWVHIWDLVSNQMVYELRATDSIQVDWGVSDVHFVRFSPDGHTLTSLTGDGTLRTWNADTGKVLSTTFISNMPIYDAALNSDSTKIAFGGDTGTIQIITFPIILSLDAVSMLGL